MSIHFSTAKLGHWLFTVGLSVCLGIVVFSQVVGRNGNFVSSVSVFWMGIGPLSPPQSLSTPLVIQVGLNATATCCSEEGSTLENNEGIGIDSSDDGVSSYSGSSADGFSDKELHEEIEARNRNGTSDNKDSHFPQKMSFGGDYINQVESNKVANGTNTLISNRVIDKISKGTNNTTKVKLPLSFTPVVPSVSSRTGSENINKNIFDTNIVEGSPHDALDVKFKLSTVTEPVSISDMVLLLHQAAASSHSQRPRWCSIRDKELLSAKLQLKKTPILHNAPKLDASVYRNVSIFRRSYELMESVLKVYVYGEGEKPVFHQPTLDGIYAAEGWFIKLMEENKRFTVQDPSEAHLFFLPFSVKSLRALFYGKFHGWKSRMLHIDNYVDLISRKYPFWNRTQGADHFLVACHDWGPRMTSGRAKNCIRSLCNANAGDGFRIGKDATLPVTFVRKAKEPLRDLGVKLPSKRPTLAFFAGSMHGDLRPLLVKYWQNKEPDMVILGSLPRNGQGQKIYRDHMKNSKYCICARGYEVHTPRIVEAIFQECVPVIIADNYVPPFFEVLNWESFAVFVKEKDVANLRKILVSIPHRKYRLMQQRVKVVQEHFLWHKKPVRYDLFNMILHSVWHNRLSQMK
ncbi:unnamed protein product [Rhodiola kirilowii]